MFTKKNKDTKIVVGENVHIDVSVVFGANCKNIEIGYGSFIGKDIYIDCEELSIGQYTTIHHGSIIHGKSCHIGHNCWFGHYTIIDSLGGNTLIGNGVGVGAHSQLWSHMKFGDVMAGCRWNSSNRLQIDDDVWLVGHSITGPIHAKAKSMLMTGSVAVKNMQENHIYTGSPAKDVTDRFGYQFKPITLESKMELFSKYLNNFSKEGGNAEKFKVVTEFSDDLYESGFTQFNLSARTYMPLYNSNETKFIRYMLYDKAKFVPVLQSGFVS